MPYYKWSGVDIIGTITKGHMSAPSVADLDALLFKRGIALINQKETNVPFITRSISLSQKIFVLHYLAALLKAGVKLSEALLIVANQVQHPRLQDIIYNIAAQVHRGGNVITAFKKYKLYDALVLQMLAVGVESGMLAKTLQAAVAYLERKQMLKKQLRQILSMPLITAGFVCLVAVFIFGFIMPRFTDMFSTMKQDLPAITKSMIQISGLFTGFNITFGFLLFFTCILGIRKWLRSSRKRASEKILLKLPFLGPIIRYRYIYYGLYALSLLLRNGMQMVQALYVVATMFGDSIFKDYFMFLQKEVIAGNSLSFAMADSTLFDSDAVAMITIGEESGFMADMIERVAQFYHMKLQKLLKGFTLLLQPLLMIVLGLLVMLLLLAVYVPIISFSQFV